MESQIPEYPFFYPTATSQNSKPNHTISWLGFCFSLFVLLLSWISFWISAEIISNSSDTYSGGASVVIMIFLLIGIPLGIAGLVFSIIGIIKASNQGGKKWIGIYGLVFTGCTILTILLLPLILSLCYTKEPGQVVTPPNISTVDTQENGVVLTIDGYSLICSDNRNGEDTSPYHTHAGSPREIAEDLNMWYHLHNIEKDASVKIKVADGTDYTVVYHLSDALAEIGITKFQIMTL